MPRDRVVIVGAGVAGLVSAFALAARGLDVTVLERAATRPAARCGKSRSGRRRSTAVRPFSPCAGYSTSCLAQPAGISPITSACKPLETLARHAWDENTRLDLFADEERTVDAIGGFAGAAEAEGYRAFCRDTKRIYDILEKPFLRAPQASMAGLIGAGGFRGLMRLPQIKPFSSMWSALGQYFRDPRLQQLFGRYATYCGSSPYLAPATLMLVAHVERSGVWSIEGGMHALAQALAEGAKSFGATIRYGQEVHRSDLIDCGRACGVQLASGERHRSRCRDRECRHGGGRRRIVRRQCRAVPPRLFHHAPARYRRVTWSVVAKAQRFSARAVTTCFSLATTTPNSTTSFATTRCRTNRRSMSAPRIAATQDRSTLAAKNGSSCSSMRRRMATGIPTMQRRWNNAPSEHSRRWSGAACTFDGGRETTCRVTTPADFNNCSRRRAAPSTAAVRTDGPRRFSVRERRTRGYRDCIWRGQHASGPGRADGGAVGPLGGLEPARGPDFARVVHANGYAWWYIDALSDDGQSGITIIAFIGSVFSPYYAFARRKGVADPLNHCAVNVAIYRKAANRWTMTERPRGAVSRTTNSFTVGPSQSVLGRHSR